MGPSVRPLLSVKFLGQGIGRSLMPEFIGEFKDEVQL